jgi:hypothetical protein
VPSDPEHNRLREAEAWWALLARILAFFLGGAIFTFETIAEHADRTWLLIFAGGLMGPTVAASIATIVAAVRGQNGRRDQ